jgi:hypothetical protein
MAELGRRTLLTDEVVERLEAAFRVGQVSIERACAYAGISKATYMKWQRQGRAAEADGADESDPHVNFLYRMQRVRAEVEVHSLALIRDAARNGQWQAAAWWLERTNPSQWGRRQVVEVVTQDALYRRLEELERELERQGLSLDDVVEDAGLPRPE